ncbi:hypothetical protein [Thioclava atlantica]|uniref:hypothetical protein n=1 Tax=Thioclava atlantica TaxID=1317124 RepID=UPI0012E0236F|nr:hypothetical protein [Thioclava atlantica]
MSGRIFLHIGPPKTATTSLQIGLQGLHIEGASYLGTSQPRSPAQNAESNVLIRVSRADPGCTEEAQLLRASLEGRVARGETVIVSEEMFVVGDSEETIKDQLRRLVAFLEGLPTTVIVALRDPRKAIPSYYQEIYRSLPFDLVRDFDRFTRDGRTYCFDYNALCSFIESLGVDLHLIDFRLLMVSEMALSRILGPSSELDATLQLPKANVSKVSNDGELRFLPGSNLALLGETRSVKAIIDCLGLRSLPGWKRAGRIARRIPLQRSRHIALQLDAASEKHFLGSFESARRKWNPSIAPLFESHRN